MRSEAQTVEAYLDELPPERREAIDAVREVVVDRLPEGYVETVNWGMICYEVPLERSGPTYNDQPLMYAALASQKNHMALYLTSVYLDEERLGRFREAYLETGKRLDMGRSCVRFRRLEDLPLDLVGDVIAEVPVDDFVGAAQEARSRR